MIEMSGYHPVVTHLSSEEYKKLEELCSGLKCSKYKFLKDLVLEAINSHGVEKNERERKDSSGVEGRGQRPLKVSY